MRGNRQSARLGKPGKLGTFTRRWSQRIERRWRRARDRPIYWRWRRAAMSVTARRLMRSARTHHHPEPEPLSFPKLFIIGPARSGTTWVSEILGQHPDVLTEGESHAYKVILGTLTRLGTTREAWTEILARDDHARRRRSHLHIQRYVDQATFRRLVGSAMTRQLAPTDAADWLIDRIFDHFHVANGGNDDTLFVEKTPNHTIYARHILDHFPEAKLVEVLRDGRDVAVSKHLKGVAQRQGHDRWTAEERNELFRYWTRFVRIGAELRADPKYSGRIHLVRYEWLISDPDTEVSKLFDFAGLDHDSELVANIVAATAFGTRGRTGQGQHRRKGIVGDWQNYFTDDDVQAFVEIAGDELRRSGYDLTP